MKSIENATGILMKKNEPVLSFCISGGFYEEFEIINRSLLPIDFEINDNDKDAFRIFLRDRVVPATRIHINSDVKKIGMMYYDPDALFHFTHGRSVEDDYWVKFNSDENLLTYEKLTQRLDAVGK
ncbi:MAG: hypothetical protein IJ733_05750 [Lachnospiraceae bacterium]|nr:hypothetical protein [Lachnospiraceae bacterium]